MPSAAVAIWGWFHLWEPGQEFGSHEVRVRSGSSEVWEDLKLNLTGLRLVSLGGRLIEPPVGAIISALSKCPLVVVGSGCLRCLLVSSGC